MSYVFGGRMYFTFTVVPAGPCRSAWTLSAGRPAVFSLSTRKMMSPTLSIPDDFADPFSDERNAAGG